VHTKPQDQSLEEEELLGIAKYSSIRGIMCDPSITGTLGFTSSKDF